MKKSTLKLFSAMLSATTLVSSLPMISATAVDNSNSSVVQHQQANSIASSDSCIDDCSWTDGDLTLTDSNPEDVPVINSVEEYYEITGKEPDPQSVSTDKAGYDLPDSFDNSTSKYFPPIGDQDELNSCTAWANGYY
ncbi:MAG: hypothetical protein UD936_07490, partial [Acutalibacteraceae bacterium]|nr:hypothetical protein [Acutalibacteraceae bacterium]